ncbi:MAG: hypothetical protein BRD21_10715 [Halobacteriales archaeon SW_8_66_22]|jgi:hypothetical protein|nr:MAG: hypothetical protein BRD08_10545 [Halobacteriales archaeon SW_10_66_29]PSQ49129.1 MAG: hypothetical protein BRD19_04660 [Halobacteriales archaeon SW_7_65_23]PSQ61095.1 MAG: hypothetical protein BRD21_10715 [Halobacteriales archaeon SW_8_66_22]
MGYRVIENVEDRVGDRVIRRKIFQTDDPEFPSGYRYALHYGYTDGRGTILRYDNENETPGRHERHTPEGVEQIEFPGMLTLRERFMTEIEEKP